MRARWAVGLVTLATASSCASGAPATGKAADGGIAANAMVASPVDSCSRARANLKRSADSLLAIPLATWAKQPGNDSLIAQASAKGKVLIWFVVDTTGVPDVSTLRIPGSRDAALLSLTRETLGQMRFTAAQAMPGCPVRMLVFQQIHSGAP
ncbi:MAG: hypothetical protein ACR2OG_06495 [Gemmatimonadaceae bacterium]